MKNKNKIKKIEAKKGIAKKIALSFGVFMIFFVLTGILKSKADSGKNVMGWLWSNSEDGITNSAVGYISMNNSNSEANGGIPYGVSIPGSDGAVTGQAWSENLGYIDFAPAGPYPGAPYNSVVRSGNSLQGWARFMEIQNAATVGNSGGWQGWIKMSGTAQNGTPYGVTIDTATGKLNGYAWSEELGAISFRGTAQSGIEYGAKMPLPPVVSLSSNVMAINLDNGALPQSMTLSWNVSGAATCTKSGGTWSGSLTNPTTGSESVSQNTPTVTYKFTCSGPGGTTFATADVTTGCNKKACAANACASTFMITGTSDESMCISQSTCSTDSECRPLEAQSWKEVSPN